MGPCFRTIGCTHLENRLKYRYLDDPRFWERLHVGPSATVEKTRVFYTYRPPIKRCVHALARTRGPIRRGASSGKWSCVLDNKKRRWLWVPVFAGTT